VSVYISLMSEFYISPGTQTLYYLV